MLNNAFMGILNLLRIPLYNYQLESSWFYIIIVILPMYIVTDLYSVIHYTEYTIDSRYKLLEPVKSNLRSYSRSQTSFDTVVPKKTSDTVVPKKHLLIQWSPKNNFWYSGPQKTYFDKVVPWNNLLIQWYPQKTFFTVLPKKSLDTVVPKNNILIQWSQRKGVRYFPKCIFPRATSQVTFSQVATSQMWNFPSGNFPNVHFPKARTFDGLNLWRRL